MVNELVPQVVDLYSNIPDSEKVVGIPEEYLRSMSFIKFKLDKDRNVLINDVTNEENKELYVRIIGIRLERVVIDNGELVCVSRDGKYSKDGVLCETCPNVFNRPFKDEVEQKALYEAACRIHNIDNPPPWNDKTKCSYRLIINWLEQFEKNEDGTYTWIVQPGLCYLSCPPASLAAMAFNQTGYLDRLKSKGYRDFKPVVTVISVGQRRNEKLKTTYSFETFDMEGTYDSITKKCVNYKEMMQALGTVPQLESAPTPQHQIAPKVEPEPVHPELPQTAVKTPPAPAKQAEKTTKATPVARTAEPAEKAVETPKPVQPAPSSTELRLKVKYAYATLPADVQQIILNVLKIDAIEKLTDNDLKVAFETLQLAAKEVENRSGDAQSLAPEEPANQPVLPKKKTTPW